MTAYGVSSNVNVLNFPLLSGALYISGSVSLSTPLTATITSSFSVNIGNQVTVSGSTGLMVAAPPVAPLYITNTGSLAVAPGDGAVFPVTVQTWGTNVTASVVLAGQGSGGAILTDIANWPAAIAVSGSQLTGSTFSGFPVVMGGAFLSGGVGPSNTQYVRALATDVSGALYITTSGTLPVTLAGSSGGQISVTSTGSLAVAPGDGAVFPVSVQGQVSVDNFPATQNVSGSVTVGAWGTNVTASVLLAGQGAGGSIATAITNWPAVIGVTGSAPIQVYSSGTVGVSGTVSIGGQVQVSNFPATQNVSGTVIADIGNWPATFGVTASAPLQVWEAGTVGVSGTVNLGSQVQVSNFPATQNVSGSITVGAWGTNVTASVVLPGTGTVVNLGNWPAVLGITASAPVQVWNEGTVGVSGTVTLGSQVQVSNFPATQNVSGSVTIGAWGTNVTGTVTLAGQGSGGAILTAITNWPAVVGVTASAPIQVWSEGNVGISGTVSISGQVGVDNFPAVQAVSGSQLTGSTFAGSPVVVGGAWASGSLVNNSQYVKAIAVDASGSVYITTSGTLPVAVQGTVTVSEASQIQVSNFPATQNVSGSITVGTWGTNVTASIFANQGAPAWITGSVALNPVPVITANTATTGSAGLAVGNAPYAPLYVTGSVTLNPGLVVTASITASITQTVTVSGSTGLLVATAPYAPLFVTGSVALNPSPVITANTATTGSAGLAVGNAPYQPLYVAVTGNLPVVVGDGSNNFPVAQQGPVFLGNWPAVEAVSGSQLTGSTFSGFPVVVGGAYLSGGVGPSNTQYVRAIATDVSGAVYVTSTGSLSVAPGDGVTFPVSIAATVNVAQQGQVQVSNFPATQNVSGTVNVTPTSPSGYWFAGTSGVSGSVALTNWPAVVGVTASAALQVWEAGTVGVSGTVTAEVGNWPAVIAVSGSQLTGSTFSGFPVVVGGAFLSGGIGPSNTQYVRALALDVSGALYITTTGSLPVTLAGSSGGQISVTSTGSLAVAPGDGAVFPVSISSTVNTSQQGPVYIGNWPATIGVSGSATLNVAQQGQIQVSNFPATQNVSGTVSITQPIQVYSSGTLGVSGAVALTNWPALIGVSGTVTVAAPLQVFSSGTVGVSGAVALTNWPAIIGVTASAPIQVWSEGSIGVTGSVSITNSEISVNNFPATQNVSGTVTAEIGNWPAALGVSGSQLTGSTFAGSPVVVGGAWAASGTNNTQYVKAIAVDYSGSVYITTSGSLPVTLAGSSGGQISVTSTGSLAVAPGDGAVFPVTLQSQVQVSNFPSTQNVSGTVQVWSEGNLGVSGTVTANVTVTGSTGLQVAAPAVAPLYVTTTGSLPVFPGDGATFPVSIAATVNVAQQGQIQVSNFPATQNVSGTVTAEIGNWPAVSAVTGSQLTGSTFGGFPVVVGGAYLSGGVGPSNTQYVRALSLDVSGAAYITTTGSLAVAPGDGVTFPVSVAATVNVAQQGQIQVSNFPATQNVSGTVTANVTVTGSTGLLVASSPALPLYITSTGSLAVAPGDGTTFPVSIAATVNTSQQGQIQVSNFPATQNVSGTVNVTPTSPSGFWTTGPTGVSGSVALTNWPAVEAVSGSQLTGSTFSGFPVVVGGAYLSGGAGPSNTQYVRALSLDVSGAAYITTTGSLAVAPGDGVTFPVSIASTVNVAQQGQVGVYNFPATQNISGTVNVTPTSPSGFWFAGTAGVSGTVTSNPTVTGATGLMVGNSTVAPLYITNTGSLAVAPGDGATFPVSIASTVNTSQQGPVYLGNWPAVEAVSGSQLTGSTFTGFPVVVGGAFLSGGVGPSNTQYVRALSLDVSGAAYITTTGSLAVAPGDGVTFPVSVAATVNVAQQGQVGVYNFPATQNVSGTITANVTTTGSTGLLVSFGDTPPSINTATTGSAGLAVGNAPYQPLYISTTGSIPVSPNDGVTFPVSIAAPVQIWSEGTIGVSGNLTTTPSFNNTPQSVTGSVVTGSTAPGLPVLVGGAWASNVTNNTQYIKSLAVDYSGSVFITSTGSLAVAPGDGATFLITPTSPSGFWFAGTTGVSGTVTSNPTVTGSTGLMVASSPALPLWVTGTVTTTGGGGGGGSVTQGTSPWLDAITNWPATFGVSGSQLTGSTFAGSPVVVGGAYLSGGIGPSNTQYVRALSLDVSGAAYVTSTGSLPVVGTIGFLSGIVQVWTEGSFGVSGTVTANVTVTGSTGLMTTAQKGYTSAGSVFECNVVSAMTASTLVNANDARFFASFHNAYFSTGSWFLGIGFTPVAPTASSGQGVIGSSYGLYTVQLLPGDTFTLDNASVGCSVAGICNTVTGTLYVTEVST